MGKRSKKSKPESEELLISHVPALHQPYPWLMICDGRDKNQQRIYSITEDRFHSCFYPELHKNEVVICSNNKKWLVYQEDSTKDCFLFNISTLEKFPLPPVEDLIDYPVILLSSSPTPTVDRACRIIFYGMDRLLSCNLGDTIFIDRELMRETHDPILEGSVNFSGKIFVLTSWYNLATADYSDPRLVFETIIQGCEVDKLLPMHDDCKTYLVESCGQIMFIYTRCRGCELTDLKIFRAKFSTSEWVAVKNLGDQAIFIDADHSFSSPASKYGLRGNCVYYVNEYGRNLFVFDLEDLSISMSLPCPIAKPTSSLFWMSISDE